VENLESNLTAAEVLARWPATVRVFLARKLGCVGCAMAPFDTLADVARTYAFDLEAFVSELEAAIAAGPSPRLEVFGE